MDRKQSTSSAADDIMSGLMIMLLVFAAVLFLAPSVLFALIVVLITRRLPWHITTAAMLLCLGIALGTVHFSGGIKSYLLLLAGGFETILETGGWRGFPWGAYIGSSLLFGPPLAGIGLAVLPLLRLPKAQMGSRTNTSRSKGFLEKFMLARLAKTKHPVNGTYLGTSQNSTKNIVISDKELNQHCFAIGTTGSGKTTTLLNFAESAIQRGLPTLYIDGKGEVKLVEQLKRLAERYGRKFYLFSVNNHPDSSRWNPLARGKPTELKDKMISITEWTEPHYKYEAERYLQAVFTLFEKLRMRPDIPSVAQYLYPRAAQNLAREIQDEYLRETLQEELRAGKTVEGLANRIAVLAASEIGDLFRDDDKKAQPKREAKERNLDLGGLLGLEQRQEDDTADYVTRAPLARDERPVLDLDRAIREKAVVLFSMNSLRFKEFSQLIGRLVVNDLRTTIARRYDYPERDYIFGIFDEFHVFASLQVVDILAQARGAGFCTIIATQSLSDLDLVDPDLTGRIVENCNTFIIQAQNYPKNAERLAAIIGTQDSIARTFQVEGHMVQVGTGLGSWREVKEFIVHPDEIKRLQRGEAIVVRKAGGFKVEKVWIRKPEMI